MDKTIPFPQADDFEKIISILNVDNVEDLKNNDALRMYVGEITDRQINYYLSASAYLGILNTKREFTEIGLELRPLTLKKQEIELIRLIISNKIFGTIYVTEKVLGFKMPKEDIVDFMKENIDLSSDEMYNRRAQTVYKWLEWVDKKMNLNKEY